MSVKEWDGGLAKLVASVDGKRIVKTYNITSDAKKRFYVDASRAFKRLYIDKTGFMKKRLDIVFDFSGGEGYLIKDTPVEFKVIGVRSSGGEDTLYAGSFLVRVVDPRDKEAYVKRYTVPISPEKLAEYDRIKVVAKIGSGKTAETVYDLSQLERMHLKSRDDLTFVITSVHLDLPGYKDNRFFGRIYGCTNGSYEGYASVEVIRNGHVIGRGTIPEYKRIRGCVDTVVYDRLTRLPRVGDVIRVKVDGLELESRVPEPVLEPGSASITDDYARFYLKIRGPSRIEGKIEVVYQYRDGKPVEEREVVSATDNVDVITLWASARGIRDVLKKKGEVEALITVRAPGGREVFTPKTYYIKVVRDGNSYKIVEFRNASDADRIRILSTGEGRGAAASPAKAVGAGGSGEAESRRVKVPSIPVEVFKPAPVKVVTVPSLRVGPARAGRRQRESLVLL